MASRMPAVHCVKECNELKCSRYLFLPAVDIERTFCRGCTSWLRVGSVSICTWSDIGQQTDGARTILIEASAKLMNDGATSPSWPAVSRASASQNERTVPTSWAKHSVHTRFGLGFPPAPVSKLDNSIVYADSLVSRSSNFRK